MKYSFSFSCIPTVLLMLVCFAFNDQQKELKKSFANVIIKEKYSIPSTCSGMFLEARADALGREYLYVAAKDAGLKIFKADGSTTPVASYSVDSFRSLHVMNFSQSGNLLFLALGNHFGNGTQAPGMAIIDVADPMHPFIRSVWQDGSAHGGAGIVEADGKYAYVGGMRNGIYILDISDPSKPKYLSNYIPPLDFPDAKYSARKINARGMLVKNDMLYLCYDAGGLRVINLFDKRHPVEIGRYSNPEMNGRPRAYNNIMIDDTIAYIAVDYCGMEILNIKDPMNIKRISWWNPWNCQASSMKWFSSNGHCNEIALDKTNHLAFISSGKSDLMVVDVSDPQRPNYKQVFGGVSNKMGTWGVSLNGNSIYLTYICAVVPFFSNWTGVKVLSYTLQ